MDFHGAKFNRQAPAEATAARNASSTDREKTELFVHPTVLALHLPQASQSNSVHNS
jgi:hypothetical protein